MQHTLSSRPCNAARHHFTQGNASQGRLPAGLEGLTLGVALQMFRDAQRPGWWPLEKWNKAQMDRKLLDLQKIYKVAQKRWQVMRKAVKERETGKRGKGQP